MVGMSCALLVVSERDMQGRAGGRDRAMQCLFEFEAKRGVSARFFFVCREESKNGKIWRRR